MINDWVENQEEERIAVGGGGEWGGGIQPWVAFKCARWRLSSSPVPSQPTLCPQGRGKLEKEAALCTQRECRITVLSEEIFPGAA